MTKKHKISLLENAHSFIDEALMKAVMAETSPIQWKYAIFCLVQAIELLLKERLRKEHYTLIFQNIDKPINTVNIDLAIERLKKISKINFTDEDLSAIQSAKKWRNLIVHYEFELNDIEHKLVFTRLLGFTMHFHKREFKESLESIVDSYSWVKALSIIEFSNELFARAQVLIVEEKISPDLIMTCPQCGYDSFVYQDGIDHCYVCGYSEPVIECIGCGKFFLESEFEIYQAGDEVYEKYCHSCYENRLYEDDYYHYKTFGYD